MAGDGVETYQHYAQELEELLKLTPSYPDLLNRRGLLRYHRGDLAGARADFLAALARNPTYEEARVNLAFTAAAEDPGGAVKMLAAVAKSSSTPCTRFIDMACLCQAHARVDQARDAIHHAMVLAPEDPRPHHWAAFFCERQGNRRQARVHLLSCGRLPGGCVEGYEALGVRARDEVDLDALVDKILKASPNPRFRTIHEDASRHLAAAGLREEALAELRNILVLDPSFSPYATARGCIELVQGRHRKAERWLRRALEFRPGHPPTHQSLARLYDELDDPLRTERHLVEALRHAPNYPDLQYELATLCSRTDRFEEAVTHLKSCLAIDPTFAMARFRLGECYLLLGQWEAAKEQFVQLPEDVRQRPDVSSVLAECLAACAVG